MPFFRSSVKELEDHVTSVVLPVAEVFNITLNAFGVIAFRGDEGAGEIVLTQAWDRPREPAPMTPTGDSEPFAILSGTIKAALASSPQYGNRELIVTPILALGGTGT